MSDNAEEFGPTLSRVFARLFPALHNELTAQGIAPTGPDVAYYEDSGSTDAPITVIAAVPIGDDVPEPDGIAVRTLPAVTRAATTVPHGNMDNVADGYEALLRWAANAGERFDGFSREIYLSCGGPRDTWGTE